MPKAPTSYSHFRRGRVKKRTRKERGYDEEWLRFRQRALADPESFGLPHDFMFCHDCKPVLKRTEEIHHKIRVSVRPDLKYTPSNLMGLCKRCHSKRTARGE